MKITFGYKLILMFLMMNLFACAQKASKSENIIQDKVVKNIYKSELIIFKNPELINKLENIITEDNSCKKIKKNLDWYIEFNNSKQIIVTQGRIANLIELNNDSPKIRIHTTIINNQIVFVLMSNEYQNLISKSGFQIGLDNKIGETSLAFEHFSYWIIKNDIDLFKIVNSKIVKCD